VQFRADLDLETGPFAGRVEHVASGRAARIQSLEELRAFVIRLLAELRAGDADARGDPPGGVG
jgi:hypothetical protein